jgi:K+-sensing histidine kinase KdpD
LGLYIDRSMVEAHGGTLAATSRGRDKGATFSLAVPLRQGMSIESATSKAA